MQPAVRPHIRREDALWVCRGGESPAGYGFNPCAALREWRLMHIHHLTHRAGKPAGQAQEARTPTPRLMAHLGTFEDLRRV
jgi:hypothetical protein